MLELINTLIVGNESIKLDIYLFSWETDEGFRQFLNKNFYVIQQKKSALTDAFTTDSIIIIIEQLTALK
jgi:hypothetical protein